MPSIPGMPNLSPEQMQAFQQMMSGGAGGGGSNPLAAMMGGAGAGGPQPSGMPSMRPTPQDIRNDTPAEAKRWITLYPIYFDAKRAHKVGERRVPWSQSTLCPQSISIVRALQKIGGIKFVHEPGRTHPRDWENPGRVKVKLFGESEQPCIAGIANRKDLTKKVAVELQKISGSPPLELPKRPKAPKKPKKEAKAKAAVKGTSGQDKSTGKGASAVKPAAPAASTVASKEATASTSSNHKLARIVPGRSVRSSQIYRQKLLQGYLPPPHVRLPPHSPSLSADLLNMDLGAAMGGPSGGGANPMGALGGMMGNLGFGEEDQADKEEDDEEAARKKANDPYKGMGRRGRKRVVRVGR